MNKDNLIEFAKEQCEIFPEDSYMGKYLRETIKILQAEPCEDAISRTYLLKKFEDRFIELQKAHQKEKQLGINWCINTLKDMQPVKPTHKKGKWIDTTEISTNRRGHILHEVICSECNGISYFRSMGNKYIGANFCPNCDAKMESEE